MRKIHPHKVSLLRGMQIGTGESSMVCSVGPSTTRFFVSPDRKEIYVLEDNEEPEYRYGWWVFSGWVE